MKEFRSIVVTLAVMLSLGLASPVVLAQDGPPPDGPRQRDGGQDAGGRRDRGPGGRGGWENMTDEQREQMRERFEERRKQMEQEMNDRTREELDMSAEEFEALLPMIQKVRQLTQEQMQVGMSAMFGGRGNRGPGGRGGFGMFGGTDNMSSQGKALSDATTALRETLDKDEVGSDEIKSKLASLRSARNNMQDALRQAREELRGYITPKQEATLVLQGLLD